MGQALDTASALEFVRAHGVVLTAARGDAPRLIEAILGEPIRGNWWSHPAGSAIYNVLAEVCESPDVLVCKLLEGRQTLVHRRLWPALVRVAERFDPARLARIREEHTPRGHHVKHETPFPQWVPEDVRAQAVALDEAQALAALGPAVKVARIGAAPAHNRHSDKRDTRKGGPR